MNKKKSFFLQQFYTPEAGHTLILFDFDLIEKIKEFSKKNEIEFVEVESINDLKPW